MITREQAHTKLQSAIATLQLYETESKTRRSVNRIVSVGNAITELNHLVSHLSDQKKIKHEKNIGWEEKDDALKDEEEAEEKEGEEKEYKITEEESLLSKRVNALREQLNAIMATRGFNEIIYDRVFEIQIILARAFPANERDKRGFYLGPILYHRINPKPGVSNVIAFSSGVLERKEDVQKYYNGSNAYANGRPRHWGDNSPMSDRELRSLLSQSIIINPPPPAILQHVGEIVDVRPENIPAHIGYLIGHKIGIIISGIIFILWPLFAKAFYPFTLFSDVINSTATSTGLLTGLICVRNNFLWGMLFGIAMYQTIALYIVGAFALVTKFLIAHSLVSSVSITAITSLGNSVIFPYVIPVALIFLGSIQAYKREVSLVAIFEQWFIYITFKPVAEIFGQLGRLIGYGIGKLISCFYPPRQAIAPPIVQQPIVPAPAPVPALAPAPHPPVINPLSSVARTEQSGPPDPSSPTRAYTLLRVDISRISHQTNPITSSPTAAIVPIDRANPSPVSAPRLS